MSNKYLLLILVMTFCFLSIVKAQSTDSSGAVSSVATSTFPALVVERPDADFTPTPGSINFTQRGGLTCTLPSAVNAAGKEIVVIQTKLAFRGLYLKSQENESIIWLGRKLKGGIFNVGSSVSGDLQFFSDGKNWYWFRAYGR